MSYNDARQLNEIIKQGLGDIPNTQEVAIKLIVDRLVFRHQVNRRTAIKVAARMSINLPDTMHNDEPDLLQDLVHNSIDSVMKSIRSMDWMTRDEQEDIFLPEMAHNINIWVKL